MTKRWYDGNGKVMTTAEAASMADITFTLQGRVGTGDWTNLNDYTLGASNSWKLIVSLADYAGIYTDFRVVETVPANYKVSYLYDGETKDSVGGAAEVTIVNEPLEQITVQKTFVDSEGKTVTKIPDNAYVTVKLQVSDKIAGTYVDADAVVVTLSNTQGWTYTWTDLPSNRYYKVVETGSSCDFDHYTNNDGTRRGMIGIVNKLTTTSYSVEKVWDNQNVDSSLLTYPTVTVELRQDGSTYETYTLKASEDWKHTFENLPVGYTYTVVELDEDGRALVGGGYIGGYNVSYTNTDEKTTITNTIDLEDLKVTKTWKNVSNQNATWPSDVQSITLTLYYTLEDGTKAAYPNGTVTLKASDMTQEKDGAYSYTFTNLPTMIKGQLIDAYTIEETAVTGYNTTYSTDGLNVTNTPVTTEVSGSKTWVDANNQDGKRPTSITINLLADGEKVDSKTVTAADNWSWTFTNLKKYSTGTTPIVYTVTEDAVTDYETTYSDDHLSVTNKHEPSVVEKTVLKVWEDNEDQDGLRPESISVQLLANGKAYGEAVTLNEDNEWTYTWTELPEKANGETITYTVDEISEIAEYTTTYSTSEDTFTITNKHTPGEVEKTVLKVWEDNEDQDGLRPESISVQLQADGKDYGDAVTLSEENSWTYTWEKLPEKAEGKAITYTVKELEAIEGYTTTYSEDTFTITNTHKPGEVEKTVLKKWEDNNNEAKARPARVTVRLYNDDGYVGKVELNQDNKWQYTFENLPKVMANGAEYTYYIREAAVSSYQATYDDAENGTFLTVTNTYLTPFDDEIVPLAAGINMNEGDCFN